MLLAVDTSTAQMGLALYDGTQVLAESIWYSHQHHTVDLAPALAELMSRAGVKITDVQALGVAIGLAPSLHCAWGWHSSRASPSPASSRLSAFPPWMC